MSRSIPEASLPAEPHPTILALAKALARMMAREDDAEGETGDGREQNRNDAGSDLRPL